MSSHPETCFSFPGPETGGSPKALGVDTRDKENPEHETRARPHPPTPNLCLNTKGRHGERENEQEKKQDGGHGYNLVHS